MAGLLRVRWVVVALVVVVTVIVGAVGGQAPINNALDVWFVQDDPALVAYRQFQDRFGNDEVVVFAVRNPAGILNSEDLARIAEATDQMAKVPGIKSVTSFSTARFIRATEEDLIVERLMPGPPGDAADVATVVKRLEADPVLSGRLLSEDGTTALLVARFDAMDDVDQRRHAVLTGLYAVTDKVLRREGVDVHAAGIGLVYDELNTASFRETPLFLGLCILLVGIALFVTFRRVGPVLMALLTVLLAMGLLMGVYALLGEELNMVTAILPTMMIIIGVADTVHLVQHRAARLDEPLERSLAFIVRPCLFTTLTTAVGFGSLMSAQMQVIKDLGKYAAIGVVIALVVSVALAAAMLSVPKLAPRPRSEDETSSAFLDRGLSALGRLATGKPMAVIGLAGLITLLGAWGISRIVVDTYSIDFFKSSNPVRIDSDAIERSYGRYMPLEFSVAAPAGLEAGVQNPVFLKALAAWQAEAKTKDLAGWSTSVADVVARLNQVLREGGPEARVVPDSANAVAQALLMYESQPGNERQALTDPGYKFARITFGVPMTSAKGWGELITSLEGVARKHLPEGSRLMRGGYLPLYVRMMEYVVDSQVSSFALAYLAVFLLLGLLFRSITLAAVAMIPNLLPIFVTLGLMGILGVRLDVATVTIAAVVIGIVVDDTIHFLHRFKNELHDDAGAAGDYQEAARRTLRGAGPAMVSTSAILAIGFLVLTLASVKSIIFFGLLSAVAMVAALFADLLVLPAILISIKPRLPR